MGLFLERKYWLQIRHCGLYLFANSGQCKKFFNSFLFMGSGMRPQTVHCRVHPVDIRPAIAAVLGMTPPGSAQGSSLEEVF
jgi:hypothetical protein